MRSAFGMPRGTAASTDLVFRSINRDLPIGTDSRRRFDNLCRSGCDAQVLFGSCVVTVWGSLDPKRSKRSIYDLASFSSSEIQRLTKDVDDLARRIARLNQTKILGPLPYLADCTDNKSLPEELTLSARGRAEIYRNLPEIMQVFAADTRAAANWVQRNRGPKRLTALRLLVIKLLEYVDSNTETPHFEDVANILSHLFNHSGLINALSPTERPRKVHKLLGSPDALKQLYSRSVRYGLRRAATKA